MINVVRSAVAVGAAIATAVAGYALSDSARADSATVLGPGLVTVTIGVRYSKFSVTTLHVRPGSIVRFLIRNDDPIHHEFIVGDASVHPNEHESSALTLKGQSALVGFAVRRHAVRCRDHNPLAMNSRTTATPIRPNRSPTRA